MRIVGRHVIVRLETTSMSGLFALPFVGIYRTSERAVAALTEGLYHELCIVGLQNRPAE